MATTQKTKFLIWVTALALVMACVPSLTTQSIPTLDPGLVNTFIAQTANAALTQTAAALPSATATPFVTPTRKTETPTLTPTSTVVFLFFTPTALELSTPTSGSSSENYACQVLRVTPPNGSTFDARKDFDVVWTVKNIGQHKWERSDVDYAYFSGAKIHIISSYDLAENVKVGDMIDLTAQMQAPKSSGSYLTNWIMRRGNKTFCPLNLTIVVR